jgi:outer membrane lipoprotein-sorting protein
MRFAAVFRSEIRRAGLLVLLSVHPAGAALAEESDAEAALLRKLSDVPGLTARFREVRHSPLLAEPQAVEGRIWIAPPGVLLRETTSPMVSTLFIAESRILLLDEEGRHEFSLRDRAPAAAVGRFFFDLIAGEVEHVLRRFNVKLIETPDEQRNWTMELVPKRRRRRASVQRILIHGRDNLLRGVSFWDSDDAETAITFYDVEVSAQTPEGLAARVAAP